VATGLHGYPVDRPDPTPRVLWLGSRVLSASVVVFFFGFAFAFVYLKTLNTRGRWNPNLDVPVLFPSVGLAVVILSAVVYGVAVRRLRDDDTGPWQAWAAVAFPLLLATIGLHVWQLGSLPFEPTRGGYASVFVGWTVALVTVELGAAYWLLTVLRGSIRVVGELDPYNNEGPPPHVRHLVASARGFGFFWGVVVTVEIVAYFLLVLVR
jgi:heme/copper-type cytochrome/quinol oxidase subunit 3